MTEQEQMLALLEQQGKDFHAMKEANDKRLKKLEDDQAVGEITGQLKTIEKVLDETTLKIDNLEKEIVAKKTPEFGTDSNSFQNIAQYLVNVAEGKFQNAVRTDVSGSGGYAVPDGLDQQIDSYIMGTVGLMKLCHQAKFLPGFKRPVTLTPGTVSNATQGATIKENDSPTLGMMTSVPGKLVAKVTITQEARDDMFNDTENWVRECISMKMAEDLESELIAGTGQGGKTKGLLAYPNDEKEDPDRDWLTLQFVNTGANGAFVPFDSSTGIGPADCLIDIDTSLAEEYVTNASWLMHRKTEGIVRKLKDKEGNYLWEPGLKPGEPNKLLGYPVYRSSFMPRVATDSLAIVFGDFYRGLRIGFENEMYIVRDTSSKFPDVVLMFAKRYGLTLKDSRALKLVKFSLGSGGGEAEGGTEGGTEGGETGGGETGGGETGG